MTIETIEVPIKAFEETKLEMAKDDFQTKCILANGIYEKHTYYYLIAKGIDGRGYKNFIDVCSGLNLSKDIASNLINSGLCELKNNNVILSSEGNELQEKMNVFTRVYNNIKVEGKEANSLIDSALDELSEL